MRLYKMIFFSFYFSLFCFDISINVFFSFCLLTRYVLVDKFGFLILFIPCRKCPRTGNLLFIYKHVLTSFTFILPFTSIQQHVFSLKFELVLIQKKILCRSLYVIHDKTREHSILFKIYLI